MAEIKSTLELALERTKKLKLSEKDKEEIRKKEIEQKTLSLFHRYREDQLHLNEIQREMERMDERIREQVKEGLLSLWIDGLSLDEGGEKLLKGIEFLKCKDMEAIRETLYQLRTQYQEDEVRIRKEIEAEQLDILRREGIDGGAVEPNVEAIDLWRENLLRLTQKFQASLEDIKKQIRAL